MTSLKLNGIGHGTNYCKVKTLCANCVGNHVTTDCKEEAIKCANCNGPHKPTDDSCPNKTQYLKIKKRHRSAQNRRWTKFYSSIKVPNNFPNLLNQQTPTVRMWPQQSEVNINTNEGELFSAQHLQILTLELINNLKNCKCKLNQFNVITNLAFKFLV